MDTLSTLLEKADALFPTTDKPKLCTYNYTLGRFPYGWVFEVTNNWSAWLDAGLENRFGAYKKPEHAVMAFLNYVRENKIDVMSLTHEAEDYPDKEDT